jgi:hypothetical protein
MRDVDKCEAVVRNPTANDLATLPESRGSRSSELALKK